MAIDLRAYKQSQIKLYSLLTEQNIPILVMTAILMAISIYYSFIRYANYVLILDEPAFVGSTLKRNFYDWFTVGYSNYFKTYPEWLHNYSNFIRPVTNIIFWMEHLIFNNTYALYVSIYYLAIYLAFYEFISCTRDLKLQGIFFTTAAVIWTVSPAVVSPGFYCIPFMFDLIASVFVLNAFRAILLGRDLVAVLSLLIAVFSKETALFCAFCGDPHDFDNSASFSLHVDNSRIDAHAHSSLGRSPLFRLWRHFRRDSRQQPGLQLAGGRTNHMAPGYRMGFRDGSLIEQQC